MNANDILNALGGADESILAEAAAGREHRRPGRRFPRWAALAACLALIASLGIHAEASTGAVSNLLAPLFGTARTEIVDSIGIPVGVSATADGYTLTAEAIIGDRHNFAVVYSLTREDGQPLDGHLHFATQDLSKHRLGHGAGGIMRSVPDENDPGRMYFIEEWSTSGVIIDRQFSVSFSDLSIFVPYGEDIPVAQGPWELSYTLRYKDSGKAIPMWNFTVSDKEGTQYKFRKLEISPVGLYLSYTMIDPDWYTINGLKVSLRLKDGTELTLEGNGNYHHNKNSKTADGSYSAMFPSPVSFEEMDALILCGIEYPLDLSD